MRGMGKTKFKTAFCSVSIFRKWWFAVADIDGLLKTFRKVP